MLRYLLDTNIVIYVIKHKPERVREKFNLHAMGLCISSITVAELMYGAENSMNIPQNIRVIEDFLSRLTVINYDSHAATHYGNIKAQLKKQGKLISDNDIHIAAHARSLGLTLVTNNVKEFKRVDALKIENWVL